MLVLSQLYRHTRATLDAQSVDVRERFELKGWAQTLADAGRRSHRASGCEGPLGRVKVLALHPSVCF